MNIIFLWFFQLWHGNVKQLLIFMKIVPINDKSWNFDLFEYNVQNLE